MWEKKYILEESARTDIFFVFFIYASNFGGRGGEQTPYKPFQNKYILLINMNVLVCLCSIKDDSGVIF